MRNIGKELERKLNLTGIESAEDLISNRQQGSLFQIENCAFRDLFRASVCASGAIDNIDFNMLTEETKKDLKGIFGRIKIIYESR